jgi:glycolate oxidase iron-sulfur subunit
MDAGIKVVAAFDSLVFRTNERLGTVSPRSPFAILGNKAGFTADRLFPEVTGSPLRERVPARTRVQRPTAHVAFFTGCSFNYFYPQTGLDLLEVFAANGVEVSTPKQQNCCGTPVLVHGDRRTARTLARNNLDAFEATGADYIVTGCGSCGSAWQHDYPELFADDPVYAAKAKRWSERTYDASTFLLKVIDYRPPNGRLDAVVTYHDPCHLKKSMKVSREPRDLLRAIPGVILKEMQRPDACCGSGGSYALTHPRTSDAIARRKAEDAVATEAGTLTTGCPACMMQLLDSTHRFGSKQRVRHYISLVAESYRREEQPV